MNEGVTLSGQYRLLRKIGSGGMSEVFRGEDTGKRCEVAVKVLRDTLAEDPEAVEKFRKEAKSVSGLSHSNIVRVSDCGYDSKYNAHYIVMEYVRGESLKTYIEHQGALSSRELCQISIKIADALAAAHKAGIIHRDIKPQNIMLSSNGDVKVTDFGIACVVGNTTLTAQKEAMGSVHYMSPEQAKAADIDFRSDFYSLGISMFEMATGTLPFEGETPVAVAMQHLNKNIPNPISLNPSLWPGLSDIIRKLTQKDPNNRYQSAEDLASDLRHLLKNNYLRFKVYEPVKTLEAPSGMSRDDRIRKQSITLAGAILTVIVAFLVIFMVYTGLSIQNSINRIPSLTGLSFDDASKVCRERGYTIVEMTRQYSDAVSAGKILLQEPQAGVDMPAPYEISVILSLGSKSSEKTPLLEGLTFDEAAALLCDRQIPYSVVSSYGPEPMGMVIKQYPSSGETLDFGPNMKGVTLYVSAGEELDASVVPYLTGLSQSEALAEIAAANLSVGSITFSSHPTMPGGSVIAQSIPIGLFVAPESTIDITISTGLSSHSQIIRSGGYIELCNPLTEGLLQNLLVTALDSHGNRTVLLDDNLTYDTFSEDNILMKLAYPDGSVSINVQLDGRELLNVRINDD